MPTPTDNRIKAIRAALALGLDINSLYRKIQRREIVGGIDDHGKWWVDRDSLNAAIQRNTASEQSGAAIGGAA